MHLLTAASGHPSFKEHRREGEGEPVRQAQGPSLSFFSLRPSLRTSVLKVVRKWDRERSKERKKREKESFLP